MTSPPPKQKDIRASSSDRIGVLAWGATAFGATVIVLLSGVIWLRPATTEAPHLLPFLAFAALVLALGAVRLMLGHIRHELARKDHLLTRISRRLRSVLPADDSMRSPAGSRSIEDELERVLAGYRGANELGARVAELERELEMERRGQMARAGGRAAVPGGTASGDDAHGELTRAEHAPVKPTPSRPAPAEPAPAEPTPSGPTPAKPPPAEPAPTGSAREEDVGDVREVIERTLRLTETSFVAGSDALVRVRTAVRAIRDWRDRLSASSPRLDASGGALTVRHAISRDFRQDAAHAAVFESLAMEVRRLSDCANRLRPLADAAESMAGLAPASSSPRIPPQPPPPQPPPPQPPPPHPRGGEADRIPSASEPASGPPSELAVTALRLRGLAAELESGLAGLGTEVRVLGRAWRTRAEDGGRGGQRNGPDPAVARALDRLETQLTEVADDIAAFTRDAEQLSRELDRLRTPGRQRNGD